ncbi:MAG TPA: PAS domain-containing protein, partial [Candidatus Limnocylindrales bacterium]
MPAALSPSRSRLRPAYAVAGPALLLALLALTQLADQRAVFDPPWLLTTLNLVFLTAVPLAGAALAVPAYRRAGAGAVLAVGAGLLTLGVGCGIVPAVLRFGVDANASVSLHNISMLLAGALQFVAALAAVFGTWLGSRRGLHVVVVYVAVLAAVGATLVAVAAGALPTFWVVDSGGTQVRAVVLRAAVVLWVGSALLWLPAAARDRGVPFLDWYIGGLLLLGLSLVALVGQQQAGNASSWAARAGQYAGAATMVATLVLALRPRTGRGSTPDLGLALVQATLPFRPIVESASDGVLVVRGDGRVMYANDKA